MDGLDKVQYKFSEQCVVTAKASQRRAVVGAVFDVWFISNSIFELVFLSAADHQYRVGCWAHQIPESGTSLDNTVCNAVTVGSMHETPMDPPQKVTIVDALSLGATADCSSF